MKTILVVDDSYVIRKIARKILEDLGFSADEASSGRTAIDKCKNAMPDAIFLDWTMPDMSGIDVLLALRALAPYREPRVIFCRTENDSRAIAQALNAGADGFMMKPFDKEIVARKLGELDLSAGETEAPS